MATNIPGVNEPRDLWKSIFRGWKGIDVESVSTVVCKSKLIQIAYRAKR